jgi:PLP dependent protein
VSSPLLERYSGILKALEGTGARLIAVSKGQSVEHIQELYRAGQRDFGENYVQEILAKHQTLSSRGITDIRWHFLGHLQTNKVKQLVPLNPVIHSLDSVRLAQEISKRATGRVQVLVEVNVESEPSKTGVLPGGLAELLSGVSGLAGLEVRGLMCIPSREGGRSGEAFRNLRALRDAHRERLGPGELSMGMSEDFEVASREGSSWVRVGTALFGPRNA